MKAMQIFSASYDRIFFYNLYSHFNVLLFAGKANSSGDEEHLAREFGSVIQWIFYCIAVTDEEAFAKMTKWVPAL